MRQNSRQRPRTRDLGEALASVAEETANITNRKYLRSCQSHVRRIISFFLTANRHEHFKDVFANPVADEAGIRDFHDLLIFSDAIRNDLAPVARDECPTDQLIPIFEALGRRAQTTWIDEHVKLNPEKFCTKIGAKCFEVFQHTLSKTSNKNSSKSIALSASSLREFNKGINKYFEEVGFAVPLGHKERMTALHKKNMAIEAARRRDDLVGHTTGADFMPLELHDFLCKLLLTRGRKDDIKYLLVMLLAFNLLCRINRVFSIHLNNNHITWSQDALRICLFTTKKDKVGKSKQQVHLYANHLEPHKCVVTVLGLYLQSHGANLHSWLFPTGTTSSRFAGDPATLADDCINKHDTGCFMRYLRKSVFTTDEYKKFVRDNGWQNLNIQAHSWRKTAKTYAQSGSGALVNTKTIEIRMGSHAAAGRRQQQLSEVGDLTDDQFVGLVMSRLPYNGANFVASPPHWVVPDTELLDECFLGFRGERFPKWVSKRQVLSMALASVVWHHKKGHFPASTVQKWCTQIMVPYFGIEREVTTPTLCFETTEGMCLTGQDRGFVMMRKNRREIAALKTMMCGALDALNEVKTMLNTELPKRVAQKIDEAVAESMKGFAIYQRARDGVSQEEMQASPENCSSQRQEPLASTPTIATGSNSGAERATDIYNWADEGEPSIPMPLPKNYILQIADFGEALQLWEMGTLFKQDADGRQHRIRPFKHLKNRHWTDTRSRKMFQRLCSVMKKLGVLLHLTGKPTFIDIIDIVGSCLEHSRGTMPTNASQPRRRKRPRGADRVQPLKRKINTVYQHLCHVSEQSLESWFHEFRRSQDVQADDLV